MDTPLSSLPRVQILRCLNKDCKRTFDNAQIRYMHFLGSHPSDYKPASLLNPAITSSFERFLENKNKISNKPQQDIYTGEKGQVLLVCQAPNCQQTFDNEQLRDFHSNRMHGAQNDSILAQPTTPGLEDVCIKPGCEARFLSPELMELHCQQAHPLFWRRTYERSVSIVVATFGKKAMSLGKKDNEKEIDSMITSFDNITPLPEMSEMIFVSDDESDATSVCDSEYLYDKKDVELLDLSAATPIDAEIVFVKEVNAMVVEVKDMPTITAVECKVEVCEIVEEVKTHLRPVFQYRSRSEMMLNRNAMANPGASKWVI